MATDWSPAGPAFTLTVGGSRGGGGGGPSFARQAGGGGGVAARDRISSRDIAAIQAAREAFLAPPGGIPGVLAPLPPPPPVSLPRAPVAPPVSLPEVVVTAGRVVAPVLGVVGGLLLPSPIGRERDPRLLEPVFPRPAPPAPPPEPEPVPEPLAEVVVVGQRPPPPALPPVAAAPSADQPSIDFVGQTTIGNLVRFGLEGLTRFAGNVLRREVIGEIADALIPRPDADVIVSGPELRSGIEPLRDPRDDPFRDPMPSTVGRPRPANPSPGVSVAPDLVGLPAPVDRPSTVGTPATEPAPAPGPSVFTGSPNLNVFPITSTPTRPSTPIIRPTPITPTPISPTPILTRPPSLSPFLPPSLSPLPFAQPTRARPSNCPPCTEAKKKPKRKPREPRTICRQGTYTQTRKGISYSPKRTFPCP